MERRPGGAMARRELHFIWLLDTSGSMNADGKIQALNIAIRETIPQLRAAAGDNPNVSVLMRAMTFSNGAAWHIATPTPVANVRWTDVAASGHTDLGAALTLLAAALKVPPMPERAVSPVLVLVTDGYHTDAEDFETGLAALLAEQWGRDAVRIAITIGRDVNLQALQQFIGNDAIEPLQAQNAETLLQHIRWASRTGVESASQLADPVLRKRVQDAHQASQLSQSNTADEW
ncbi:MAG: VWA domain-containing protein [Betaproteobacteria bacterium]